MVDLEEEELLPSVSSESHTNNKSKIQMHTINSFKDYSSKVNWYVFVLICLFTLGSWIDISGKTFWKEFIKVIRTALNIYSKKVYGRNFH